MAAVSVVGPSFEKIFKFLEKKNVDMIKPIMREATVMVQKEAKLIAPYKSGRFRQSIRRSVRSFKRAGSVVGLVGVHKANRRVILYAFKLENQYHTFSILEKTQAAPVKRLFTRGLIKYFNNIKIL